VADPQMNETAAYMKVAPNVKRKSAFMQAKRFLAKPAVITYLGRLLEERQARLEMDVDWVVSRLRDIHDRCMQSIPVYLPGQSELSTGGDGEPVDPIFFKFDANGAIKALELIGKHMKMFSDKTDAGSTNVQVNINLGYDEEGRAKLIEGEFKRVG
jgi:phage terminase small subunit